MKVETWRPLMLTNYHVMEICHVPATNRKAARIRIKSQRFNQTKLIDYMSDKTGPLAIDSAKLWLHRKGFNLVGQGEMINGYYLISTTFEPLK